MSHPWPPGFSAGLPEEDAEAFMRAAERVTGLQPGTGAGYLVLVATAPDGNGDGKICTGGGGTLSPEDMISAVNALIADFSRAQPGPSGPGGHPCTLDPGQPVQLHCSEPGCGHQFPVLTTGCTTCLQAAPLLWADHLVAAHPRELITFARRAMAASN